MILGSRVEGREGEGGVGRIEELTHCVYKHKHESNTLLHGGGGLRKMTAG